MAKDLSDAAVDDIDDVFEDDTSGFDAGVEMGGKDNSIRRRIEERLERKRLQEELGYFADDFEL